MQTKEFLQSVWPDDGYYCICGKDQKNIVTPKFASKLDEAIDLATKLLDDKQDVYLTSLSEGKWVRTGIWETKGSYYQVNGENGQIFQ